MTLKCPWGVPEETWCIAPGIYRVETPSHGGFLISADRLRAMPENLRKCAFLSAYPHAFEHDRAWCAVVLAWPNHFSSDIVDSATDIYNHYYKDKNND